MTQVSTLPRRAVVAAVLSIVCGLPSGLTASQNPFKWFGGDKNTTYQTFKDPAGRFELEYPNKDWKLLPNGGSSLAVFLSKDGPTLFVDHLRLEESLTPGEIEAMPEVEASRLREQQPKAKDFKSEMIDSKAGRGVLIRYSRVATGAESVRQFSIPVGRDLYRINGVVPDKLLSKYEPIIMHMIQSFMAKAEPSAPKD